MKWKLTHNGNCEVIENYGGKTLSYNPNLGIQIIEDDGYAFKDLNGTGVLEPFKDWRLPLTMRVRDFTSRFALWQEKDCLYYRKGKIRIPQEIYHEITAFSNQDGVLDGLQANIEDLSYLDENYLVALLLLMFDNCGGNERQNELLQLILQSMKLGVLENVMYSIWEAIRIYITSHRQSDQAYI